MTNYEMVEMLREKANVTYEEAKVALEAVNWDLLDAMVLLEKQGKVTGNGSAYTTASETNDSAKKSRNGHKESDFRGGVRRLLMWLRKLIGIGNVNFFVVSRNQDELFSLPVTVVVVLLPFAFWLIFWLLLIGLFTGFKYSFRGPNLGKDKINETIEKASKMADDFKADIAQGNSTDENQ